MVNLMYLGYLKNKVDPPEGNHDFKLIEKALEEELKFVEEEADFSNGNKEPVDPDSKQFSLNCLLHGTDEMEKHLKTLYGREWRTMLGSEIKKNLCRIKTDLIATLKASSSCEHSNEPTVFDLHKDNARKKVLEALMPLIEDIEGHR